ncbi:radical SAM protein [Candidatus Halobeggiatoa sp. HSG11]|nr:radical SAM protein [Candidatus Halobeggiatoa sp. HSG11]
MKKAEKYNGLEIGPIRPPSEANSLLLRITRNCPWNNCTFCGLYKDQKFSIRPKEHLFNDIDLIKKCITVLQEASKPENFANQELLIRNLKKSLGSDLHPVYYSAANWFRNGMQSIFLQDANSMLIKPDDMVAILDYIRANFPEVERITTYSRSKTIAKISDENLKRISDAGLNRIHIGMETGCDDILKLIKKGVDKETHILAGQKTKKAGFELSEYFMPGLGGNEYSTENALETADAFNQINPDFIRIRTLALPDATELAEDYKNGVFTRANDTKMVEELLLLIQNLNGITSTIKSDHILNLISEVEGTLPHDKEKMLNALTWFLELSSQEKTIFRIGRRAGIMHRMSELSHPSIRATVESIIAEEGINDDNIDIVIDEKMKQFI